MIRRAPFLAALVLAASAFGPGLAEEAGPLGPPGAPAAAFPRPDRPVAEIVAPLWASERERDAVDEVGQVARWLRIAPGETVADVGAGSGYYATRLARRVGPGGRVFAEDVTPEYLATLRDRVAKEGLTNVALVRGEAHDPRLPRGAVDVAVMIHMYHEIVQPYGMLHNLAGAMRPGGRVGIVDADARPERHGTPPALLRCELAAVGYRETGFHVLEGGVGYLAVFEAPETAPDPASIRPCRDAPRGRSR